MDEKMKFDLDGLLTSTEFKQIVRYFLFKYQVSNEFKDDIRQVCAIAVIDAIERYEPEKCGSNFWGYSYRRMEEYAKKELELQTNVVHIPYNHTNKAFKKYENIEHTYLSIGKDIPTDVFERMNPSSYGVQIYDLDIRNAISKLDEFERNVFLMRNKVILTNNGKCSYNDIAETLNVTARKVQKTYAGVQNKLKAYFNI